MYTDEDGFEWGETSDPVGRVYLYTNRTLMVFTPSGHQIPDYQMKWKKKVVREIIDKAKEFYIAQWRNWCHKITKEEFEKLCGF